MPERLSAREILALVADADSFRELPARVRESKRDDGPLGWQGYDAARDRAAARTGERESVVCGTARVGGTRAVLIAFEFGFLGGSLGERTGDRLEAAYPHAREHRLPVVPLIATGGSRMQEGMLALTQLQRVARQSALTREAGLPQIAVLRDPTTGGGWATLGAGADIVLALPGAQVGFAGSRVRPPGADPAAYTAESQLRAGSADAIVAPAELKGVLGRWLRLLSGREARTTPDVTPTDSAQPTAPAPASAQRLEPASTPGSAQGTAPASAPGSAQGTEPAPSEPAPPSARKTAPTPTPEPVQETDPAPPVPTLAPTQWPAPTSAPGSARGNAPTPTPEPAGGNAPAPVPGALWRGGLPGSGWEAVERARAAERPRAHAYLDAYFDDRLPISGDRCGGTDPDGMLCGFGERDGRTVAYAAQTGTATRPAGYRTAARLIRLADRLGIPVLTLVDTPGAANDAEAERQGVGAAVAEVFGAVAAARVPVTTLVIGEGGSGGALALAAPGNTWATPDSYFSVIAPELAAAILKRPPEEVRSTADQLRIRPQDLAELGVIRGVV
ncbi:acetyl-CoA carboxylase [Streptomyces sp. MC1]|uniref:carboxyl transferase domain-containing protein n=1 Tax=Streptomyces sp. MC1 TaxID=295105 RepID=UPI0018C9EE76|nr:carboxyl transferase domain-containing protein [Streptomyces sp. MC1]MBG7698285.1 acetyl-CoA carboxylase [Streptomyces sp. MC1]